MLQMVPLSVHSTQGVERVHLGAYVGFKDFLSKLGGSPSSGAGSFAAPAKLGSLGEEDIEVAGESYRRDAFAHVFAAAGRPLGGVLMRTAVLVPDPQNPHDRYAVSVYVDGVHVGWVPADEAPRVQPIAIAHARAGRQLTVLARVWACCEAGDWSARVTLSCSGQTEAEWSYVDHGDWPGHRSPDGTQQLTQTGRLRRITDAETAGLIRGQDFETLRPTIAEAKARGDANAALAMLRECIDASERRAKIQGYRPATWPTEQAAILLRKQKDYLGEVLVIERFLAADPTHQGTQALCDRLARARELSGKVATVVAKPVTTGRSSIVAPDHLDLAAGSAITLVTLDGAAEVSYEKEYRDAIAAVFAEAGVALGSALETTAVLREVPQPGSRFSPVAVYVGGRLIGVVGALYADAIRTLLRQPHLVGATVGVRCRIYAREAPTFSARATLGPYESVVASLTDTQSAAEGRANSEAMAYLRRERQASGGDEAKTQAERLVRGRDFVEWVEHIKQLRRDDDNDEAMSLLMECIDATERDATANGWPPAPWYTEQAAIVLRKRGDLVAEVALLERFLAACPHDRPQVSIAERLVKARAKLDRIKE